MQKKSTFTTISDILVKFDPLKDKYISKEYQAFGVYLAEKLYDIKHKSLYIKFAKTFPRPSLEEALRFVVDSKATNKGALFMWKLKQMNILKEPKKKDKAIELL